MTLQEVIDRLLPALPVTDGEWSADLSGMTPPLEAWLRNEKNTIGLFQEESDVRAVVWVGSDMRFLMVDSPQKLSHLPEWILPHLSAQTKTEIRLAEEDKKNAAIEPPPVKEVLAALRTGTRLQLGSGRVFSTYFVDQGKLRREIFDEGEVYEMSATEMELQEALKWNAVQARRQL